MTDPARLRRRRWLVLSSAGALTVTLVDALLLERSKGFFRGGFLAVDYLTSAPQALLFLLVSWLVDAAFVGVFIVAADRVLGRTGIHPRARDAAGAAAAVGLLFADDVLTYEILRYLGDAFDFGLMWELAGRNPGEILAVASGYALVPLVVAGVGVCTLGAITRFVHVRSRGTEQDPSRIPLAVPALLLVAGIMGLGVASTRSDTLENGLLRKPAGRTMAWVVNRLTDVDRDGYGIVGRASDADPFDPAVFPYAVDVPGNGIDEDGVAGDLPAATAPYEDAPLPSAPWARHPDVVLVVLESFRADIVGRRVDGHPVTPVLDRLASAGLRLEAAYSHNGYTVQSRFHLFTGGLAGAPGSPSLIDDFSAEGYTVGYVSGQDESFGGPLYDIGFGRAAFSRDARSNRAERYSTASTPGSLAVPFHVVERGAGEFVRSVPRDRPLFLCVNFHDTHFPYWHERIASITGTDRLPRERIVPGERDRLMATYTNTAANVDRAIGAVLETVRRARGAEPGVIVISDHGESLFDGGFLGHGYDLNDSQTRVPLVVANLPLALPDPFVQADLRGAVLRAMQAPAELRSPSRVPRAADAPVFQYLGELSRPRQVAFLDRRGRLVYDFRSRRVQLRAGTWVRPGDMPKDEENDFVELIRYWERIQLARAPKWRRNA